MFWTAFTDLHYALPGREGSFVGFENFRRLMQRDQIFWHSFLLTLKFVFWVVTIEFILGFALASLLYHYIKQQLQFPVRWHISFSVNGSWGGGINA